MEPVCNGKESVSRTVFEVIGEPAIVINGVPDVTPGGATPIYPDTIHNPELSDDSCFGVWLEGRLVQKLFGDQYYSGKVMKYDRETKWYRVVYEDGDFEDLEWHELEKVLLPVDIAIPLTTLALQSFKPEKSLSVSRVNMTKMRKNHMTKMRKNHTKHSESTGKTLELFQLPQMSEPKVGSLQLQTRSHMENADIPLLKYMSEESVSKPGEDTAISNHYRNGERMANNNMPEIFHTPMVTEIKGNELVQVDAQREATVQERLRGQKEIKKQSWRTARAEKKKRGVKFLSQGSVTRPE